MGPSEKTPLPTPTVEPLDMVKSLSYRQCAVDIRFENIGYSVNVKKEKKTVLSGISGSFRHGRVNAIMGPSGAGKSSLLNALAGFNSITKGTIYINNVPYEANKCLTTMNKISSYILQDDYLIGELTARETLIYAAKFKLGPSLVEVWSELEVRKGKPDRKKNGFESVADQILRLTGLDEVAHRQVHLLSGGQRKRLAVAVELVNYPPVIYLDECTTGLDSTSCYRLVKMLKMLAKCGCNIITTIHQPNSLVFRMFDWLYVMAPGGKLAYNGHPMAVTLALKMVSVPVLSTENVADVLFEKDHIPVLAKSWNLIKDKADFASESALDKFGGQEDINIKKKLWPASIEGDIYLWVFDDVAKTYEKALEKLPRYQGTDLVRFCTAQTIPLSAQWPIYLTRTLRQSVRDKAFCIGRYIAFFLVAMITGMLFINTGSDADKVPINVGLIYFLSNAMIAGPALIVSTTADWHITNLLRENINGWYNLSVFYVVRAFVEACFNISSATLFTVITWPMTQQLLQSMSLPMAILIMCTHTIAAHHLMYFLTLYGDTQAKFQLPFVLSTVQCLLGGYMVPIANLPYWIIWLAYGNFGSWTYLALMKSSYSVTYPTIPEIPCPTDGFLCSSFPNGTVVLRTIKIEPDSPWRDVGVILANGLFYFIVGWLLTFRKMYDAKKEIARI